MPEISEDSSQISTQSSKNIPNSQNTDDWSFELNPNSQNADDWNFELNYGEEAELKAKNFEKDNSIHIIEEQATEIEFNKSIGK